MGLKIGLHRFKRVMSPLSHGEIKEGLADSPMDTGRETEMGGGQQPVNRRLSGGSEI